MDIKNRLRERNLSIKKCADYTGIPYSSLYAIVNGKTKLSDCKYSTVRALADFLNVPTDDLVPSVPPFQVFRNNLHHELKNSGVLCFIVKYLESNTIRQLWNSGNHAYSLYLLSMVDHLSLENGLPLSKEYRDIRNKKLCDPYYCGASRKYIESGVIKNKPIDTFLNHNIYEGDLYDAV